MPFDPIPDDFFNKNTPSEERDLQLIIVIAPTGFSLIYKPEIHFEMMLSELQRWQECLIGIDLIQTQLGFPSLQLSGQLLGEIPKDFDPSTMKPFGKCVSQDGQTRIDVPAVVHESIRPRLVSTMKQAFLEGGNDFIKNNVKVTVIERDV